MNGRGKEGVREGRMGDEWREGWLGRGGGEGRGEGRGGW